MATFELDATAAGLLGRERKCAAIEQLLEAASRAESSSLVLRGQPGIGKTALLGYAASHAAGLGMKVIRVAGVEAESELAFAGLHGLLRPITDKLGQLPEAQAAALGAALGLAEAPGSTVAEAEALHGSLEQLWESREAAPALAGRPQVRIVQTVETETYWGLMNHRNEARRSARVIGRLFLTALVSLALLAPAGSAAPHSLGNIHGCGVLIDAAHPWRSQVPGGNVETGDHWITDRQDTNSSCAFTHATIRKLLALTPRTYRGRDVGHRGSRLALSAPAVVRSRAQTVRAATLTIRDPVLGRLRFNALLAGDPQQARQGRLVLFLHGFPETAESFREILPTVARAGYYAVAFSQRGYSPRARPPAVGAYNITNLVGDVTRVAASLEAPTFHLVGHDWGAGVAWVTAALYPKLVTSLTVLSTPDPDALSAAIANPMSPQHAASHYITTLRAAGSQNRILAHRVKGFKALFALGGGGLPATIVDAYARAIATPAALGAAIDWYRSNPFPTPRLGPIKVPTLYLWGAKDAVFLRSTANATAAYVQAPYTLCVLSGQGHWLPEDAAEEIVAPLLSQLAGSRLRCPSTSATHRTH